MMSTKSKHEIRFDNPSYYFIVISYNDKISVINIIRGQIILNIW